MALGKFSKLRAIEVGRGVELKYAIVTGGAAATNLTCTGIGLADQIVMAVNFAAGVPSDLGSEVSIPSAGHVKFSTTDTTGDKVLVAWFAKAA